MKASRVLTKVIKMFENGQWIIGHWSEKDRGICKFCLDGAINYVVHENDNVSEKFKAVDATKTRGIKKYLHRAIKQFYKENGTVHSDGTPVKNSDIITFNDNFAENVGNVIDVVKNARKLARKDEALDK